VTSAKTPRQRRDRSSGESNSGAANSGVPNDDALVPAHPVDTFAEVQDAAPDNLQMQRATAGNAASRQVSAAAAAAGAAASVSGAEALKAASPARSANASVAAASAAAEAAIAAVSAAIAATNATVAAPSDQKVGGPNRAAARPAPVTRKRQVAAAAAAAAKVEGAELQPVYVDPARAELAAAEPAEVAPELVSEPIAAAEALQDAELLPVIQTLTWPTPPALALRPSRSGVGRPRRSAGHREPAPIADTAALADSEPPSHSGITRAGSSAEVPEYQAVTEPLFSNEGIVRRSEASHHGIGRRILGVPVGVAVALAAAGSALGHSVGAHLPGRSATTPESLPASSTFDGASMVGVPTPGPEVVPPSGALHRVAGTSAVTTLAAVLLALRTGLVYAASAAGSAAGVLIGAISWPIHKIARRGSAAQLDPVAVDAFSTEKRRRRAPVFALLFVGFFVALYGYVVVAGLILPTVAEAPSASATHGIAVVVPSATSTPTRASTPTVATTATPTATTIASPTAAPTRPPTAVPTKKPAPKPTKKPTPKPTPTPNPVFVTFEADGTKSGQYTASSTVANGHRFTLFVDTYPGAACSLSEPGHGTLAGTGVAPSTKPSFIFRWGRDGAGAPYTYWPAGAYTVTATCTFGGGKASRTIKVTIT
jgi:hypothetical protein